MKLVRSALIGGALLVATAGSSFAQDMMSWVPYGVYVRGDFGGAFGNNVTFRDNNSAAANTTIGNNSISAHGGNSVIFGAGIGYRVNPWFRGDFTLDYMPSLNVNRTTAGSSNSNTVSANLNSLVGMANGYLDFNSFLPNFFGSVEPYIDGGIGFANNNLGTVTNSTGGTAGTLSGSSQTNFAWGAGAGVNFPLTQQLSLDVAYKYLDLGSLKSGNVSTNGFAVGNSGAVTGIKSNDLTVNTVTVGLRWTFGAPMAPPPAPVAAPPAPAPAAMAPSKQMFIVFFEFDKSSLTPDGKKVVDAAAAAFKSGKSNVALAGYTDLSGTQQYNLALSHRRADMVKAALVKDGVPASVIAENWYGKQNPRVPTADGVREPQNRRVEITM
jgi:outer membrane protein OmpA-like peptidoglycan-associated protein